jgi:hypothetical protein
MDTVSGTNALPGFLRRALWAAQMGKSDFTAKRWQDAGKIVVVYMGKDPYVDLEKTAARLRGDDKRRGGRAV